MTKKGEISILIAKLQKEFEPLFGEIETKYGYKFSFGNRSKFDSQMNLYFQLEAVKDGAQSLEAQRYEEHRVFLKLPPLNTCLRYGSKRYTVVGINKTGTKVLGKNEANGNTYLLPLDIAQAMWKLQKENEENKALSGE